MQLYASAASAPTLNSHQLTLKIWIFLLIFLLGSRDRISSLTITGSNTCEPCLCQNYTREYVDVTCVNVPLTAIPRLWDPGTGKFWQASSSPHQNPSSHPQPPPLPHHQQNLYRIRLIGVELLTTLAADSFEGLGSLSSLTVSKSRLTHLNESLFSGSPLRGTLSTVDLSYGALGEVPTEALRPLQQLQWLSLRGNQIETVRGKDFAQLASRATLRTLLLSENLLSSLEERTFEPLTALESLEIDFSALERVEGPAVFPPSLLSLSLANGLLRKVPVEALARLPRLQSLSLRGNLINHLSPLKLGANTDPTDPAESGQSKSAASSPPSPRSIDVIDLSHNLIAHLPEDLFSAAGSTSNSAAAAAPNRRAEARRFSGGNGFSNYTTPSSKTLVSKSSAENKSLPNLEPTMEIRSLHLDFNFITALPPALFSSVRIEKLTLSSNRIAELPETLFAWPSPLAASLAVLDLNYNLLEGLSALRPLTALRQLTLKNNRIREIAQPDLVFEGCSATLELLDLSQNLLEAMPVFNRLQSLVKVNLHQNLIRRLAAADFEGGGWCARLRSLSLSKNSLTSVEADTFRSCSSLTELRLGGNRLLQLDSRTVDGLAAALGSSLRLLDFSSLGSLERWISEDEEEDQTSLQQFPHVKWLQLDLNALKRLPKALGRRLPSLRHLDLQNNAISGELGGGELLRQFSNLTTLILSQNRLTTLKRGAFAGLSRLESVALYYNRIERIEQGAFSGLPRLHSLVLTANQLASVEVGAFQLSTLATSTSASQSAAAAAVTVMLDQNRLQCLAANSFSLLIETTTTTTEKTSNYSLNAAEFPRVNRTSTLNNIINNNSMLRLYLNVSHNQIKTFSPDCSPSSGTADSEKVEEEKEEEEEEGSFFTPNKLANQAGQTLKQSQSSSQSWRLPLPIRVLDVSANRLAGQLSHYFLTVFCSSAVSLIANQNQLRRLPARLPASLQTLSLNHNQIMGVAENEEEEKKGKEEQVEKLSTSSRLHTLSLRHNAIADLTSFRAFFARLPALKALDLTGNRLEAIPGRRFFAGTSLVKLILADNRLTLEDDGDNDMSDMDDSCFGLSASLKILDLGGNRLAALSQRLLACSALVELLASGNRIASYRTLASPLVRALPLLQRLDLQAQQQQKDEHQRSSTSLSLAFLANHSSLSSLNLNHLAIGGGLFGGGGDSGDGGGDSHHHHNHNHNHQQAQILAVPFLHRLELAGNGLPTIGSRTLSRCRNIRHLNLAANRLQEVPKHVWKYLTRLRYLDLRDNPIDILDSSSFAGLKYLQHLYISGLKLQYIDSRLFLYQSQLSSLKISTYPAMRSFRLQDILARSDALKTIEIEVREALLSHQIQWAFGGKLRELVITGQSLTHILPDAFQGLDNANDLTLRITNTSIRQLPDGLLKYLADIRYISIDLRRNQLETVSPGVFFGSGVADGGDGDDDDDHVRTWQSRQLLGGIVLEGNPLRCDCNLLWISRWMKALFAEMKSINIEAAILVKASLAHSRCLPSAAAAAVGKGLSKASSKAKSREKIAITQLTEEHVDGHCEQGAGGNRKDHRSAGRYFTSSAAAAGHARTSSWLQLNSANTSLLISLLVTVLLLPMITG